MDLKNWKSSYKALKTEAGLSRIALAGCSIALALSVFQNLNQETIVVVQPWTMHNTGFVGSDSASQSYKEAWGLALAQLLGNVNAGNLDFIGKRIGPLLPVDIYQKYMTTLKAQTIQLKENRITTRFDPEKIVYEKSSDKVFIFGNYFTKVPGRAEQKSDRTYEFILNIDSYLPQVLSIDTYEDEPRTEKRLEQLKNKQANEQEQESEA